MDCLREVICKPAGGARQISAGERARELRCATNLAFAKRENGAEQAAYHQD